MYRLLNPTDEEKFEMYMHLKKKELVRMLIEADKYFPEPDVYIPSLSYNHEGYKKKSDGILKSLLKKFR